MPLTISYYTPLMTYVNNLLGVFYSRLIHQLSSIDLFDLVTTDSFFYRSRRHLKSFNLYPGNQLI